MPASPVIVSINTKSPHHSPVGLIVKQNASNQINLRVTASADHSGPISTFISVVGTPPPSSDTRQEPSHHILPPVNPREVVDVLDACDEDPFTLETFESMINLHAEKNLDFIIARVCTVRFDFYQFSLNSFTKVDPDDETRFYYSYYAAHHINKVLFRTQPEEGLLHRMRAKNVSKITYVDQN